MPFQSTELKISIKTALAFSNTFKLAPLSGYYNKKISYLNNRQITLNFMIINFIDNTKIYTENEKMKSLSSTFLKKLLAKC